MKKKGKTVQGETRKIVTKIIQQKEIEEKGRGEDKIKGQNKEIKKKRKRREESRKEERQERGRRGKQCKEKHQKIVVKSEHWEEPEDKGREEDKIKGS